MRCSSTRRRGDNDRRSGRRCSDTRGRPDRRRGPRARAATSRRGQAGPAHARARPLWLPRSAADRRARSQDTGWADRAPGRAGLRLRPQPRRATRSTARTRMDVEEALRQMRQAGDVTEALHRRRGAAGARRTSARPSAGPAAAARRARSSTCSGRPGRDRRAQGCIGSQRGVQRRPQRARVADQDAERARVAEVGQAVGSVRPRRCTNRSGTAGRARARRVQRATLRCPHGSGDLCRDRRGRRRRSIAAQYAASARGTAHGVLRFGLPRPARLRYVVRRAQPRAAAGRAAGVAGVGRDQSLPVSADADGAPAAAPADAASAARPSSPSAWQQAIAAKAFCSTGRTCPTCSACEAIRLDVDRLSTQPHTAARLCGAATRACRPSRESPTTQRREGRAVQRPQGRARPARRRRADRRSPATSSSWSRAAPIRSSSRYRLDGRLVGVAIVDRAADALSAVYCFYDPDRGALSLGTYSILKQIALCRSWGLRYLYLGLYVGDCNAMRYKARYMPHERLVAGVWQRFERATA